jgi:large subunit ribosomal protein L31
VDRFYKKLTARQTYVEQQKVKEELKGSPERPIEELGISARAIDSLKKAGIENFGQFLEKLNGGNDAVCNQGLVRLDSCQEEIALARL